MAVAHEGFVSSHAAMTDSLAEASTPVKAEVSLSGGVGGWVGFPPRGLGASYALFGAMGCRVSDVPVVRGKEISGISSGGSSIGVPAFLNFQAIT